MRTYLFALLICSSFLLTGCIPKNQAETIEGEYTPPIWADTSEVSGVSGTETADEADSIDSTEETAAVETEGTSAEQTSVSDSYLDNDFTLGIQMSTDYSFEYAINSSGYTKVEASSKYPGFYTALNKAGKSVLLTPQLQTVKYPKSVDFEVLEPFLYGGVVYFRVQSLDTNWSEPPRGREGWLGLGDYAVVLSDGTYSIPFGDYEYIDRFVEGMARAYCEYTKSYDIIDPNGTVLRTYPMENKVEPYQLFPDGYIYTRSDVDGYSAVIGHTHAILDWDGNIIMPYDAYAEHIVPIYKGDGIFVVENNGFDVYSKGQPVRKFPINRNNIISMNGGKVITGAVVNGLVGPLADREYTVTDYSGKVLIPPGQYTFETGWTGGVALAHKAGKAVLLDSNCEEIEMPDGVELVGRYAKDAPLFMVRITADFRLWRYADVLGKYENPVGIMDGSLKWVIPPGELESIENLPLSSVSQFSRYISGSGDEADKLLHIIRKQF